VLFHLYEFTLSGSLTPKGVLNVAPTVFGSIFPLVDAGPPPVSVTFFGSGFGTGFNEIIMNTALISGYSGAIATNISCERLAPTDGINMTCVSNAAVLNAGYVQISVRRNGATSAAKPVGRIRTSSNASDLRISCSHIFVPRPRISANIKLDIISERDYVAVGRLGIQFDFTVDVYTCCHS
jgi:hypothetical protein